MTLTLDSVAYAYTRGAVDPVKALEGVSLSVERGKLTLVIGPTGSGKSTLMRVAAGLLEPTQGTVSLDGQPLSSGSAGGVIGLIFQDPESQLFADTVLDDVAFGPRNMGLAPDEAHERATEALAAVGLDPSSFGVRSPFSLSGGEARRAAIAGVLAMRPFYLLADEPTAGLDAGGRSAVRDLLLRQRDHSGVMVVSHAAEQFLSVADRLVILSAGTVAWSGPGSHVIDDPGILSSRGLAIPDVLEVQHLAAKQGLAIERFSMDAPDAARAIVAAARGL